MLSLPSALGRAAGQLTDPAILRVLAKSIAVTLAIFLAAGFGAAAGIEALLARWKIAGSDEIGALLGVILTLVGGWLLFRIVALAVLQFFADGVVRAVEVKHYPDVPASARDPRWQEELGMGARATLRAILANLLALVLAIPLLFTAIGPAVLFWAVNAWLLGRELQDLAWARHRHSRGAVAPVRAPERFLLGGVVAGLLAVPFVNLVAPVIGAAAAVHLVHRRKEGSLEA